MPTNLRADVERYIDHFRTEHGRIKTLNSALHRKLLVVTMLDALARGRNPDKANEDRFIRLIEGHGVWPHATSVSAPQLAMMIEDRGGPAACGVSDELFRRLCEGEWRRRNPAAIDGLDRDPKLTDLLLTTPTKAELQLVTQAKHSSLLYAYRCTLVHEYREPGHGMEFDQRETAPYYHTMMHQGDLGETTELVYPTGWFIELVPPILDSLAAYYVENERNPYDAYRFGSPWRA
jgi:hypothetical protein